MKFSFKKLFITGALLFSFGYAVPYTPMNMDQLLIKQKDGGATIDLKYFQSRIQELSKPAGMYPTQFDSAEDHETAAKEALVLLEMAQVITENQKSPNNLFMAMQAGRIAHNLDIKGAAEQTVAYSTELIDLMPEDSSGYLFLGAFLAETGKFKEAKPYLDKALEMGNENARWSIALLYLFEGDKDKALEEFKIYQEKVPNDGRTADVIDAIEKNQVELNHKEIPQ